MRKNLFIRSMMRTPYCIALHMLSFLSHGTMRMCEVT